MKSTRFRVAVAAAAALPLIAVAACSSSSGGSGSSGGTTTISLLTDNTPQTAAFAKPLVAAFEKANPTIKVKVQTRPGGADGDNLVKTKLATGDMSDVFWYNSGRPGAGTVAGEEPGRPDQQPGLAAVDKAFLPVVSVGGKVYGAPWAARFGGGVLYNKAVYSKLGLQVPTTWAEFLSNSDKIKAAGLTAIEGSFKVPDTWTTQSDRAGRLLQPAEG